MPYIHTHNTTTAFQKFISGIFFPLNTAFIYQSVIRMAAIKNFSHTEWNCCVVGFFLLQNFSRASSFAVHIWWMSAKLFEILSIEIDDGIRKILWFGDVEVFFYITKGLMTIIWSRTAQFVKKNINSFSVICASQSTHNVYSINFKWLNNISKTKEKSIIDEETGQNNQSSIKICKINKRIIKKIGQQLNSVNAISIKLFIFKYHRMIFVSFGLMENL